MRGSYRVGSDRHSGPPGEDWKQGGSLEEVVAHYRQFYKCVEALNPAAPLLTTQPGVVPPVWTVR